MRPPAMKNLSQTKDPKSSTTSLLLFYLIFFYSLYEGTGKRLLVKFRRKKLSFGQIFFS